MALRQIRGLIFRLENVNISTGYPIDSPVDEYPRGYTLGLKEPT
jgi:hypothetical protein